MELESLTLKSTSQSLRDDSYDLDGPQPSFPKFKGKPGEWDAFWLKFQILADRYRWTGQLLAEQLLLSLSNEALTFAATLSPIVRCHPQTLIQALRDRFSDNTPVQTYRAKLTQLKKSYKEDLKEYAYRVRSLMLKAFPDIRHSQTYEELQIQYFLDGLPDKTLAYEVLVRKPRDLYEATNLVTWHEHCRNATNMKKPLCVNQCRDKNMEDVIRKTNSIEVSKNTMCYKCNADDHLSSKCPLILNRLKDKSFHAIREVFLSTHDEKTIPSDNCLPHYSKREMTTMQEEDEDLGIIHKWFDQQEMPDRDEINQYSPTIKNYWFNISNIVRSEGLLYRKRFISAIKYEYQLLVPQVIQEEIISDHHCLTRTCHSGVRKTSQTIRQKFYWYKMKKDVRDYIRCCSSCNQHKPPIRRSTTICNYRPKLPNGEMDRVTKPAKGRNVTKGLWLKRMTRDVYHRTGRDENPRVKTLKDWAKSVLTCDNEMNHGQTKSFWWRPTEMGQPAEADDLCN